MSRIRTIKPEFAQSEDIGRLSRDARLLFIQLWTVVDDEGRARAHSKMLAGLLYPYDDDARSLIDGWLDELESNGQIVRYEIDGSTYLEICKWLKHQKIDHSTKSKIPAPKENSRISRETSRNLASVSDGIAPDLGPGTKDRESSSLRSEDLECSLRSHSSSPDEPADDGDQSSDPVELKAKRQKPEDTELILDLVDEWNAEAARLGLPQVLDITSKRQSALRARIRDFPTFGYENPKSGFRALLAKIRGSPFLLGQTQANFRADFDFITRQSSFLKIMEGNYEAKNKTFAGTC